jgi:hypothetical protein
VDCRDFKSRDHPKPHWAIRASEANVTVASAYVGCSRGSRGGKTRRKQQKPVLFFVFIALDWLFRSTRRLGAPTLGQVTNPGLTLLEGSASTGNTDYEEKWEVVRDTMGEGNRI